jgi:hypothetical protein
MAFANIPLDFCAGAGGVGAATTCLTGLLACFTCSPTEPSTGSESALSLSWG